MKNLLLIILLNIVLFSPCQAGETIKIAAIYPKTGVGVMTYGEFPEYEAIRYTIEEINNSGGLLSKKIVLLEFDNKSTALGSRLAAQKAAKAGVVAVIGSAWSSYSLAMAPILQRAKIPMISTVSTHVDLTLMGDYIFRVCFNDNIQSKVAASFAITDLKAKKASILVNMDNKFSPQLARLFEKAFTEFGGEIVSRGDYLEEFKDYEPLLKKAVRDDPDIIFLPGYERDSAHIIKQARKMGIKQPFIGSDTWALVMYSYVGNYMEGNYFTDHWHRNNPNLISRNFVFNYEKKLGPITTSRIPLAHDAIMLLADAIKRAGSLDRSKIRKALAATEDFEGVTGKISFDENGDPVKSVEILKFEKGDIFRVKKVSPASWR